MIPPRPTPPGPGPITARRVVDDALAMRRQSFWRIAAAALVFFAVPAALTIVAESVIPELHFDRQLVTLAAVLTTVFFVISLRMLGLVALAGFLEEAVAKEYLDGRRRRLPDVLRALPWRPLIVADFVVVLVVVTGLSLLFIPGLVAFGLLAMVGPVIVRERAPVADSFRRTIDLARKAPALVTMLLVLPFAFEQLLHLAIDTNLHSSGIGVRVLAEWLVAFLVGATLGLLEVALASQLMSRYPRPVDHAAQI